MVIRLSGESGSLSRRTKDPLRHPEFKARQAGHPTGILGRLLARIMAMETVNVNRRVLDLLELEGGSRVLEVGFGHGRTLARVAELAPKD
jgi:tRNA G46 methylase TrmB